MNPEMLLGLIALTAMSAGPMGKLASNISAPVKPLRWCLALRPPTIASDDKFSMPLHKRVV